MYWLLIEQGRAAEPAGCTPNEPILAALQAWVAGDRPGAEAAVERAEAALKCSAPVDPSALARLWILEGVVLDAKGDHAAASDNFAGARQVAPDVWLPDLGPELRAKWEAAAPASGHGGITIHPDPGIRPVWIDGEALGVEVSAGLHLVQVGDPETERAVFGETVWVDPGTALEVETGLPTIAAPALAPVPVPIGVVLEPERPPRTPRSPRDAGLVGFQVLVGGGAAFGDELRNRTEREPSVQVVLPTEIGVVVRPDPGFVRLDLGAGWLAGGQYLASGADGRIVMPMSLDLALAGGAGGDRCWAGAQAGARWPSRIGLRGLVGLAPIDPLVTELRLGVNLPTERAPEPAVELLVGVGW